MLKSIFERMGAHSTKDNDKADPETWCPYPWFNLNSNTDGSVKLCCSILENHHLKDKLKVFNFGKDDIKDIWNSEYLKSARHNLSSGIKFKHCDVCWKMETNGIESSRKAALRDKLHTIDVEPTALPQSLELRLGNKCNLKCMSCWSLSSSSIYSERLSALKNSTDLPDWMLQSWRKEIQDVDAVDKTWNDSEIFKKNFKTVAPTLKRLYLTGGEPTLIDENCEFLGYLLEAGNTDCAVSFTTNATIWNEKFYNQILQFKNSEIQISLDGFGALNDYIRYGSKWEVIEKNLNKIFALPNRVVIKVFTVVGLLNVKNVTELLSFLMDKYSHRPFIHSPIILQAPQCLSTTILSGAYRYEAAEEIKAFLSKNPEDSHVWFKDGLIRILEQLYHNVGAQTEMDFHRGRSRDYINTLDRIRKMEHPNKREIFERGLSGE
jgi:sulfatase maturation enzyme AslB (radical SAM superfamily)